MTGLHIVVVAGGELPRDGWPKMRQLVANADVVIAADHGLDHCQSLGVDPDVVLGDFDSVDAELLQAARTRDVAIIEFPADKDATDLELALDAAIDRGAASITVVAAFGGRVDHTLASIGLLAASQYDHVSLAATDGRRNAWVVRDQVVLAEPVGQTISLLPLYGDVAGVTTRGMRWPLSGETLTLGSTRGVSNVAVEAEQVVAVEAGVLIVVADRLESEV